MSQAEPLSYWLATADEFETPTALPGRAQVVVVGGGVFGVSTAFFLAQAGADVLLLESGRLAGGATGRNAGIVHPSTTQDYREAIAQWGHTTARVMWQFTEDSAALLRQVIAEEDIEAHYRVEGGYSLALSLEEAEQRQATIDQLAHDGIPMLWLDRDALQARVAFPLTDAVQGARFNPRGAVVHSARLVVGLARTARQYGAWIRQNTTVTAVRRGEVETRHGVVKADHIVLCTNAWTGALLPGVGEVIRPVRGQMLATAPLDRRVFPGAWSANGGMEYWQQAWDNSLIIGGMRRAAPDLDVGYTSAHLRPEVQAALDQFVESFFPGLINVPITHRWAGIMGFTPDGAPLIGPLGEGVWLNAGCTGHGMPFATEAGRQIARWIVAGEPERDMRPFDPRRFTP